MQILVTGATGLIGSHLVPKLQEYAQITVYTRNVSSAQNQLSKQLRYTSSLDGFSSLDEFDAIINLAGEPIFDKRWSESQKAEICQSRWQLTEKLVALCQAGNNPPTVFISGSAIGYYGRQGITAITEESAQVNDEFSHRLCQKWEDIALGAASDATRVCLLRTGVVLSKKGGALDKMVPMFRLGLGGQLANGQQYMSWIHIDDMLAAIVFLLDHSECEGAFNLTAPNPVSNKQFSQALANQLGRPCFFRTPGFVLKLALGERADLLLTGQRVIPQKLMDAGFNFRYPTIEDAFANLNL